MNDEIIIDDMTSHDLDEVLQIERLSTPSPWSKALFKKELDHDHSSNLAARALCKDEEKLVGYIVYWLVSDEMHILNLAVHPDMRRKGIGRALVEEVLKRGSEEGLVKAFLEVRKSNSPAIALYEYFHFKKVGERKAYYKDGEDAIVMVLEL